jgi:Predicted transcriptional regulators
MGLRVKAWRQEHNLTQTEFAELLGLSGVSTISKMENSLKYNPRPSTIKRLAEVTGFSYDEIMSWDKE